MHTSPFAEILGRNECFGLNASLNATRVKWARLFKLSEFINRSSIISSYDLPVTTNIKIPGRTIRKVMGGRGGGIFEPQEFFFVIEFLVWIFFRPYHECFLGLIGMHEFFSFNFPLREYFFCTSLLCLLISMLTDWKKAINAKNIDRS